MEQRKKRTKYLVMAVVLLLCSIVATVAFAKYGLSTEEIKTIQRKLKNWGYYSGEVDGIYGSATTNAVKYFQRTNGLSVDGIVGSKTAEKLGMQLGKDKDSSTSQPDVYLLARVVYGEARGEPYRGKVAVAAVVLNRMKSPDFPNTMAGVVYQKGAFSIVDDGQINLTPDEEALRAARDALNGVDPTGGCTFYYTPDKTSNKYMLSKPVVTVIGNHRFCK